jgi:hypothetical protein
MFERFLLFLPAALGAARSVTAAALAGSATAPSAKAAAALLDVSSPGEGD